MLPIKEEHAEVLQLIPLKPVEDCTTEKFVDVPVPQLRGDIDEVIQLIPRERISFCTSSPNVPVPQIREDIAEVTAFGFVGVSMTHT